MECRNQSTRERIVRAAEKLFAEKGYTETTTREIVREAGASLSSLQSHFQGKESVYFEVRRRAIEKLQRIMQPSIDEVRYLDAQGLLYGEMAWNLLSEIVSKYTDWCFDAENRRTIILINRELMDGSPVEGLPEEAILDNFLVMKLLCERYTGEGPTSWSRLISQILFSALLSFSCYAYQPDESKRRQLAVGLPREEVRYQVKSYALLTLRAYLDVRKARPQEEPPLPEAQDPPGGAG